MTKSTPPTTNTSIGEFRKKFEQLDVKRKKFTAQAVERRRQDVWEMMCQEIPQTEMASLLGVCRATIATDVKSWKERVAKRVSRMKESVDHANTELGLTIQKLDAITAAAFQEYSMAKSGCLVGSTRIWTNRGMVPIKEVVPGDQVVVYDDGAAVMAPVVCLIPKGKRPVYRLRTRHREIIATANHPFLRHDARAEEEWTALECLVPQDRKQSPRVVGDKIFISTELPSTRMPPRLRKFVPPYSENSFVRLTSQGKDALESARGTWTKAGFRGEFLRDHGLKIQWSHIRIGQHGVRLAVQKEMIASPDLKLADHH